ncbi:hypothetical protein Tco_1234208, partial [Tanacetum coccineum]
SILNYEDLKAKFRSHFSQQKNFTKTHLAVRNIKQRKGESTRAFATRYTDDNLQILGLYKDQRISSFVHGLRTRSLVEHLSTDIPSTYKGLMEKTYTWIKAREVATNGAPNYGHDTNDLRQLRSQIEEAVKSRQRSHLVKGIKKERAKAFKNQRLKGKKDKGTTPTEAPILMIRKAESYTRDNTYEDFISEGREITFPSVTRGSNYSAPVIIKEKIFGRESSGEIPLEIMIGDTPLARRETLNFFIVRSDSPYNMLLGRIAMQKMGIVVSTLNEAIKFQTAKGIRTVFSSYESDKIKEGMKKGKPFKIEHKLNEYSHIKPIKQKRRGLGPDRNIAACKEVEELMKAEILRKVKHQTWVSNPVMEKKSDGGWRMCVDFMDINKACPKDCYPLLEID